MNTSYLSAWQSFTVAAILSMFLCMPGFSQSGSLSAEAEELRTYSKAAVEWLDEQVAPNVMVESPIPQRRNLIISYRPPADDPAFPYLRGRSYLYDNALGAIAFTMAERYTEAEDLLFALSRQLQPDGSLRFGMNLHNAWPNEEDHSDAVIRSGASAWAGYAGVFYLEKRMALDSAYSLNDRIARRILFFVEKCAAHLESLQIRAEDDPRYGLVTGGRGTHALDYDGESVTVSFEDTRLGWVSAEHNIDAWFLFSGLARITGEQRWKQTAEMTARGLLGMWDDERNQLIQGIKEDGRRDTVLPLDTASWGSMFLRAAGEESLAEKALDTAIERFYNSESGGFRPYAGDKVYLKDSVSAAYFTDADITWNDLDITWPEGSLGVATALIQADRTDEAVKIIRSSAGFAVDGGIRYASLEIPHQFSTYPSVASTAWMVIAVETLLDDTDRQLFWRAR